MSSLERVLGVMARLRDPSGGCPWDRRQDFASIAPYTIEEAYEVADAIAREDFAALADELGDLLFQVVFHAQMASERGLFDFEAVCAGLAEKLVRRHPHVFGELAGSDDPEVGEIWEAQKRAERERAAQPSDSALDGATTGLPALLRARKLQQRAARVGFDWDAPAPVFDKLAEELGELRAASGRGDAPAVTDELGDLLFAAVNLARHLDVDPEAALLQGNRKFERRFRAMEQRLRAAGRELQDCTARELDLAWEQAKREVGGG